MKKPSGKQIFSSEQLLSAEETSLSANASLKSFLIKHQNNKLTLYKISENDSLSVIEEYDIDISLLPEEDRYSLSEGITVDSFEEALALLEDFSS